MGRRCTLERCDVVNDRKFAFLDIPVANILARPERDWRLLVSSAMNKSKVAKHLINVDWKKYNTEDYLFTHATIVSSVATDETKYRIVEPCDELVNANGNAWTNHVLPYCFRTFCGAENYYEHVQIPELSKGKILDAVMRPVIYVSNESDKKSDVFYVDILVATNRKHVNLVKRIENGELSTLSMGAIANKCQCSFCGTVTDDYTDNCKHLEHSLKKYLEADNGISYIVAELCGALDSQGRYIEHSCDFIEASWVEQPAFTGAVVNYYIDNPQDKGRLEMERKDLSQLFSSEDIFSKLKVADIKNMIAIKIAIQEIRRQRYQGIIENIVFDMKKA